MTGKRWGFISKSKKKIHWISCMGQLSNIPSKGWQTRTLICVICPHTWHIPSAYGVLHSDLPVSSLGVVLRDNCVLARKFQVHLIWYGLNHPMHKWNLFETFEDLMVPRFTWGYFFKLDCCRTWNATRAVCVDLHWNRSYCWWKQSRYRYTRWCSISSMNGMTKGGHCHWSMNFFSIWIYSGCVRCLSTDARCVCPK